VIRFFAGDGEQCVDGRRAVHAKPGRANGMSGSDSGGFLFGRITAIGGDCPPQEPTAVTGEALTVTVGHILGTSM